MLTSILNSALVLLLFLTQTFASTILTEIVGCSLDNLSTTKGLHGTIYGLSSGQTDLISSSAFYDGGYSSESQLGTFDNGGAVSFKVNGASTSLYGVAVDSSNFVMESAGYFKADQSGLYEFDLSNVDDGVMLFIGTSVFDCCSSTLTGGSPDSFLWATKPLNSGNTMVYKSWVYMEAGQFYPFKIVFVNAISAGGMSLNVVTPDGTSADIGNYIYQVTNPTAGTCSAVTVSSEFFTSTSWVISGTKTITTEYPVTSGSSTYIVEQINYPSNVLTTSSTEFWTGSTTRIRTVTSYVSYYQTSVPAEVIIKDIPNYSTITRTSSNYFYTATALTVVNGVTSTYVVVYNPAPSTTYIQTNIKTLSTTTSASIITQPTTTYTSNEVYIYGPSVSTVFVYPGVYKSGQNLVYTTISGTAQWVMAVNSQVATVHSTWSRYGVTEYLTSTTYVSNGRTYTSAYMLDVGFAQTTVTSYWTQSTTNTYGYILGLTTDTSGIVYGSLEWVVYYPALKTSFIQSNVGSTTTIQNAQTSYVEVYGSFPTVTSFGSNAYFKTSAYTYVTSGSSTGWEYVYIYPSPSISVSQWSESSTLTSTSTIIQDGTIQGFVEYLYVPYYSTSLYFWSGTSYNTITTEKVISNSLSIIGTSTYVIIQRPNMPTVTSTWTETYGTTTYGETEYVGGDGYPVTTSEAFVNIPSPRPTTVTSSVSVCSGVTQSFTCIGSSTIVTVGTALVTISTTSCAIPTNTSGSFGYSESTTVYSDSTTTTTITVSNAVIPIFTCNTSTLNSSTSENMATSSVVVPSSSSSTPTPLAPASSTPASSTPASSAPASSDSSTSENMATSSVVVPSSSSSTPPSSAPFSSSESESSTSSTPTSSSTPASSSEPDSSSSTSMNTTISSSTSTSGSSYNASNSSTSWESSDSFDSSESSNAVISSVPLNSPPFSSSSTLFSTPSPTNTNSSSLSIALPSLTSSLSVPLFTSFTTSTTTNSVCSAATTMYTTVKTENDTTETVYSVVILTPPVSCNIFYTTEPATGCETSTSTSFIGTVNTDGMYVNATLIIIETPANTCDLIPSSSSGELSPSSIEYTQKTLIETVTSCIDNSCSENIVTVTDLITSSTTTCPESSFQSIPTTLTTGTTSATEPGATTGATSATEPGATTGATSATEPGATTGATSNIVFNPTTLTTSSASQGYNGNETTSTSEDSGISQYTSAPQETSSSISFTSGPDQSVEIYSAGGSRIFEFKKYSLLLVFASYFC